jgi:hypothetical protein
MMVEAWLEAEEVESAEMYNTLMMTETESWIVGGLHGLGSNDDDLQTEVNKDVLHRQD